MFKSLFIGGWITEVLNGKSIADGVEDLMISFHFFNGSFMEGSPVKIEDDHNQKCDNIGDSNDKIGSLVAIGEISEREAG